MPAPYSGGCLCSEVRYVLNAEPLTLYACHCTDCQRSSGSAFGLSLVVNRGSLQGQQGKSVQYSVKRPDGRTSRGQLCTACMTRLWSEPLKHPDVVIVRPGTLDDTSWLRPVAHIWTRSAQPWFKFPPDAVLFEGQPAPGELSKIWQHRNSAAPQT